MTSATVLLLSLLALRPACGSEFITPEMDQSLMEGIDDIYRMRFDDAEAAARKAIALNPEHPHPYMGLAAVTWTRYVYGLHEDDPSLLPVFAKETGQTIEVGERWVKAHPQDAQGLMALGSAYGLSSRLAILQRQWLRGYLQGRKAVAITRQAVSADPKCWDCYLGIGMYDYYTDVYPRFIGVLAKLVLRGDRLRGIKTLEMVADRGHYSKSNAMILLVEIYLEDRWGARDPEKALIIMRHLRALYPDSAMMHEAELESLFAGKHYEEALASGQDLLEKIKQGQYGAMEAVKALVMTGGVLWQLGRLDDALESFHRAQAELYNGKPGRWSVWARIRAAQLEDVMGRRAQALDDYRAAQDSPEPWGFRRLARAGLAGPYAMKKPGDIDPPDE